MVSHYDSFSLRTFGTMNSPRFGFIVEGGKKGERFGEGEETKKKKTKMLGLEPFRRSIINLTVREVHFDVLNVPVYYSLSKVYFAET